MPPRKPLGVVAGVLRSPCASIQTSAHARDASRAPRPAPAARACTRSSATTGVPPATASRLLRAARAGAAGSVSSGAPSPKAMGGGAGGSARGAPRRGQLDSQLDGCSVSRGHPAARELGDDRLQHGGRLREGGAPRRHRVRRPNRSTPSSQANPASAAASKKQYAPGMPLGGLPMPTQAGRIVRRPRPRADGRPHQLEIAADEERAGVDERRAPDQQEAHAGRRRRSRRTRRCAARRPGPRWPRRRPRPSSRRSPGGAGRRTAASARAPAP